MTIDDETAAWIGEMKRKVADRSIWAEIEAQPEPEQIVERWRQGRKRRADG